MGKIGYTFLNCAFIRGFLPDKNNEVASSPDKLFDPDYVDPFTGKKNDEFGYQPDRPQSDRPLEQYYKNENFRNYVRTARANKDFSKQANRSLWER